MWVDSTLVQNPKPDHLIFLGGKVPSKDFLQTTLEFNP